MNCPVDALELPFTVPLILYNTHSDKYFTHFKLFVARKLTATGEM